MYSKELSELVKFKTTHVSERELKFQKLSYTESNLEKEDNDLEHYENIIKNNPILYRKVVLAY